MTAAALEIAPRLFAAAHDLCFDAGDDVPWHHTIARIADAGVGGGLTLDDYFLAAAELAVLPRTAALWSMYDALFRTDYDAAMRAGLFGLKTGPLTEEQAALIARLDDLYLWYLWENRRRDHNARLGRWPQWSGAEPFPADGDFGLFAAPPPPDERAWPAQAELTRYNAALSSLEQAKAASAQGLGEWVPMEVYKQSLERAVSLSRGAG